jgi:hypothetical protein
MTEPTTFNAATSERSFPGGPGSYAIVLTEQYKLCVEMADRVSGRRALANGLFLTGNTVLVTAAVTARSALVAMPPLRLALPLLGALLLCLAWYQTIEMYRRLNSAKFAVIRELEQRLPAVPLTGAEWPRLGLGRRRGTYTRLTNMEKGLPVLFAVAYLTAYLCLVLL